MIIVSSEYLKQEISFLLAAMRNMATTLSAHSRSSEVLKRSSRKESAWRTPYTTQNQRTLLAAKIGTVFTIPCSHSAFLFSTSVDTLDLRCYVRLPPFQSRIPTTTDIFLRGLHLSAIISWVLPSSMCISDSAFFYSSIITAEVNVLQILGDSFTRYNESINAHF